MGLLLDSLGFLGSLTTSLPLYYSYELIDPYFCHVSTLSLPLYFLGFPNPFTSSLPLIIPMGFFGPFTHSLPLVTFMSLLAINPANSTHWACFLISLPFCPSFLSHLPYCWVSSAAGPFVKNGHRHLAS